MPRIIVVPDTNHVDVVLNSGAVLLDEHIAPAHLEDDHSAHQIIERVAWAVSDAAEVEQQGHA